MVKIPIIISTGMLLKAAKTLVGGQVASIKPVQIQIGHLIRLAK